MVEIGSRAATGNLLGARVIDEDLRFLKISMLYEQGIPLLFQKRFALSVTKGFDDFGASSKVNPVPLLISCVLPPVPRLRSPSRGGF